jgi:hypothetical protein
MQQWKHHHLNLWSRAVFAHPRYAVATVLVCVQLLYAETIPEQAMLHTRCIADITRLLSSAVSVCRERGSPAGQQPQPQLQLSMQPRKSMEIVQSGVQTGTRVKAAHKSRSGKEDLLQVCEALHMNKPTCPPYALNMLHAYVL